MLADFLKDYFPIIIFLIIALGISCVFIGPAQHNEEEQLQIVADLLAKGVDGISMAPSNAPAMGKLLRKQNTNNIPIITFDSDLQAEDRDLRLAYVGTHNYAIGVNLESTAPQAVFVFPATNFG